jgi:NTE family protein
MALAIAQDSEYQGNEFWAWSVWISGPADQLDSVERVTYTLHASFPDPVRTVTDRSTGFRLETGGWGVFRLYATVHYRDGSSEDLEHDLELTSPDDRPPPRRKMPGVLREDQVAVGTDHIDASGDGAADGAFEGGAASMIALGAALLAAREQAGISRWMNVVGSSGGAVVATLVAVGYEPREIVEMFSELEGKRWADRGSWGTWGALYRLMSRSGMQEGKRFTEWLDGVLEEKVGTRSATFGHVLDPSTLSSIGRYRLRLIASDITSSRMVVLPDDLEDYTDEDGNPLMPDDFPLARAVRMSMSVPFLFTPDKLYRNGEPHYFVDGRLLSTFPIWLFDTPNPKWPTWGFHVHGSSDTEQLERPRPAVFRGGSFIRLAEAMLTSVVEAWDTRYLPKHTALRTINIETPRSIGTNKLNLSEHEKSELYELGYESARAFFAPAREYTNSFRATLATPVV